MKANKVARLVSGCLLIIIIIVILWARNNSNIVFSPSLDEAKLSRLAKEYVSEVTDAENEAFNREYKSLNEDELKRFNEIVVENQDASQEEKEFLIKMNDKVMIESKRLFNKPFNKLSNSEIDQLFNKIEETETGMSWEKKSALYQGVSTEK